MRGPASVSRIVERNCSVALHSTSSNYINHSRKHASVPPFHSCHRLSSLITANHASSRRIHSRSCAQQDTPLVQECSTADWNTPLKGQSPSDAPVSVALGKFDGMHQGHRLLAERAAASGAHPYLLSFSGMAEVLGWPARLPLVAPNDRARVLASWTTSCHGRTPQQRYIPFSMVRSLSPEAFVKVLAQDLQVSGVVVGQNYRFGYKAAGDSKMLLKLGAHYGLTVDIVDLVTASSGGVTGQVSSSKIRDALNQGLMQQVSESLGRPYRLMADVLPAELPLDCNKIRVSSQCLLNQPPRYNTAYQVEMFICQHGDSPGATPGAQSISGQAYVYEKGIEICETLSDEAKHHMLGRRLLSFDFS